MQSASLKDLKTLHSSLSVYLLDPDIGMKRIAAALATTDAMSKVAPVDYVLLDVRWLKEHGYCVAHTPDHGRTLDNDVNQVHFDIQGLSMLELYDLALHMFTLVRTQGMFEVEQMAEMIDESISLCHIEERCLNDKLVKSLKRFREKRSRRKETSPTAPRRRRRKKAALLCRVQAPPAPRPDGRNSPTVPQRAYSSACLARSVPSASTQTCTSGSSSIAGSEPVQSRVDSVGVRACILIARRLRLFSSHSASTVTRARVPRQPQPIRKRRHFPFPYLYTYPAERTKMYTIATLDDLRRHLNLSAKDADEDGDLMQRLQAASQLIESLTQRRYCPRLQTREITLDRPRQRGADFARRPAETASSSIGRSR